MEHNFQNGTLTVFLPVRIDSANAADTEAKLFDLVEDYEPNAVVMDAKDMDPLKNWPRSCGKPD